MSVNKPSQSVFWRGGLYSVASACVALLVFAVSAETIQIIENPSLPFDFSAIGATFIVGAILSLVPVPIGGVFLANILYKRALKDSISLPRAILVGSVIGAVTVLAISAVVSILALSTGKVPPNRLLLWTIEALFPGILAGGWTGGQLLRFILRCS